MGRRLPNQRRNDTVQAEPGVLVNADGESGPLRRTLLGGRFGLPQQGSSMQTSPILQRQPGALRIAALSSDETADFAGLTYPRLAGELSRLPWPWIAIGAWHGQQPIGLALGRAGTAGDAELTSLLVESDTRCRGVGKRLVAEMMQVLREKGAQRLTARIGGGNPSRLALGRALTGLGWPALQCVELKITGFAGAMAERGGQLNAVRGLLQGEAVTFDRWNSLQAQDVAALDLHLAQAGVNGGSRRFFQFDGMEPEISVIVRRAGAAVGWVVGRRSASAVPARSGVTAITYTSGYVEPSLARRGVLVGGFWHALTRQAKVFGPSSLASFQTATPRMIALGRRRLAPIALESKEVYASCCQLH